MVFTKIDIHPDDLEKRKKSFEKKCPTESKKVFEFLDLLSRGEINKGIAVTNRRLIKTIYTLNLFIPRIKKSLSKLTKDDIRDYIDRLNNDKIKRSDKKPYSDATKQDIKLLIKSYLKWRLPKRYPELTDWIDTRLKKKSPEILKEDEIEKLYNACNLGEQKFLIAILFDSGARIEEFLNIRFEDITLPTESFPYYKIDFKEEYSKTEGRDIGMYWKYSTEAIRTYLSFLDQSDSKAPVFDKKYNATRIFISRLGRKVLGKRVHPHMFRKSSATYYADKLNRQQLCVRYAWKFSSDMPDIYIKRAGVQEDLVKDAMLNTDLTKIKKENEEVKTRLSVMQDRLKFGEELLKKFAKGEILYDKEEDNFIEFKDGKPVETKNR